MNGIPSLSPLTGGFQTLMRDSSTDFERHLRQTLRRLAEQRVALVLQPGNVWVVEKAVEDNDQTDAALKTAWMRGWVEPIDDAVPKGRLGPNNELPTGEFYQSAGPIWRLTEGGWAVIKRSHGWSLVAITLSILSLVVAVCSLVVSLRGEH